MKPDDIVKKAETFVKKEMADNYDQIPFMDEDFQGLILRFLAHLIIVFVIIRLIYYPTSKRRDFLFTYFLISASSFFICWVLHNLKLDMGVGLGLFAIFGIIRYRTDTMPIREMTYLFIVIALSVVNALSSVTVSYAELLFVNLTTLIAVFTLEKITWLKHERSKIILYEKIDLIKPQKRMELIKDLEERTGIQINRVSIGKINFLRDTAQVIIYYYDHDQSQNISEYVATDTDLGDND
jgi:hypothetical protein